MCIMIPRSFFDSSLTLCYGLFGAHFLDWIATFTGVRENYTYQYMYMFSPIAYEITLHVPTAIII